MDTLKIRDIKRPDCGSIIKLIRELGNHKGESDDNITLTAKDLDRLGFTDKYGPPAFLGVIAEIKETPDAKSPQVVGVALYHVKYSTWEGEAMHLNTFIVSQKYQRQGIGSKMLCSLAKTAQEKKYLRISLEVIKSNESGLNFFAKHGAINLTKEEGWLNYGLDNAAVKKLLSDVMDKDKSVRLRPAEPKDCTRIKEMIEELAGFEKMEDGPKLTVKDLQRDGFYKLHPDFYSFVAELDDDETGEAEIIGYNLLFLSFHPFHGKRVHLEDIYVTPKYRARRVGGMLFQAIARFVEKDGYNGFTLEVLDWNEKAIQFYDKFGGVNRSLGEKGLQSLRFRHDAIANLAGIENK